jgi:hypothetical protein
MNELFLAWQHPENRSWHPVGKLTSQDGTYVFVYTQGALAPGFQPLGQMQDLRRRYQSTELFPLFANRLLPRTRPEYRSLLEWIDIAEGQEDPIQILSRTEGVRGTDTLTVFPRPYPEKNGNYCVRFFSHGVRYLPAAAIETINGLHPGVRLYIQLDVQNEFDDLAISLRTGTPPTIVGYCPRYLARDFRQILAPAEDPHLVEVHVHRVNVDAPLQLRMLCSIEGMWPEGFEPCTDGDYTPLA